MTTALDRRELLAGARALIPITAGMVAPGMICGVAAVAAGASPLAALAMSAVMFSGAAQLVAAQLLAVGAPLLVVFVSCFVIGLRLVMYSAALAPHMRTLSSRWRRLLAFFLTDQVFAMSVNRYADDRNPAGTPWYLLGGAVTLYLGWQLANLGGILLGAVLPQSWSLDFIIPLSFLGLVVPQLKDRAAISAAVAAGVAAVALDAIPLRLSLVAAGAIGIAAGMLVETWKAR